MPTIVKSFFAKGRHRPVLLMMLLHLSFVNTASSQMSEEQGNFKSPNLVELISLEPTICLDIRYATKNNFAGRAVYTQSRAFLQKPAALALLRANEELEPFGYGLMIFDGYRPWRVTKLFWDITPNEDKRFVANPKTGSRHNRGCAVDVSLYDLKTGEEVKMTSAYDEMSHRSYKNYAGGTVDQRKARDLLIKTMKSQGFTVHPYEWWHYDYKGWREYRIQDIPFSAIK